MRKINRVDEKGMRQGFWSITISHNRKNIATYLDNKIEGFCAIYASTNKLIHFAMAKKNMAHGLTIDFEGLLVSRVGFAKNGSRKGLWYDKNK